MFNKILLLSYRLFLGEGGRRVNWMEQRFGFDVEIALSSDDRRNEPETYAALFSQNNKINIEELYVELLDEMNGIPYHKCGDILDMLTFIQEISATALWRYHQGVGTVIEKFVRDFDRLDVPDERVRLYRSAQKH